VDREQTSQAGNQNGSHRRAEVAPNAQVEIGEVHPEYNTLHADLQAYFF
jgi:hypothetical protein